MQRGNIQSGLGLPAFWVGEGGALRREITVISRKSEIKHRALSRAAPRKEPHHETELGTGLVE